MQGVYATDEEDNNETLSAGITYEGAVDTAAEGAYKVTYSVTDSDDNTETKSGMVLVGDAWVVDEGGEYAIRAHGFTKRLGQVRGTEAEAISYADAVAIDLRQTLAGGAKNPTFGETVAVVVKNDGGYGEVATGAYDIVFAVADKDSVTTTARADVVTGSLPSLHVPAVKQISKGAVFGDAQIREGVTAADEEDGDLTGKVTYSGTVAPGAEGFYVVAYTVLDSDRNVATASGVVLVGDEWVVGDGYAIRAYDFSRTLGKVTGTEEEMVTSARAEAIGIDPSVPETFGKSVTVVVKSDGGYSAKKLGVYGITLAVQAKMSETKTIKATIATGDAPKLNVPDVKQISVGAVFGEAEYRKDVSASDTEDGILTDQVTHDSPVDAQTEGWYRVNYSVTDSDRNTVTRSSVVLVGDDWLVRDGFAIRAYDFTKRVEEMLGTEDEMIGSARAQAICVDSSNTAYGTAVGVVVKSDGGYAAKKAGTYGITFAVVTAPMVTTKVTATVTEDPVVVDPPEPITIVKTKTKTKTKIVPKETTIVQNTIIREVTERVIERLRDVVPEPIKELLPEPTPVAAPIEPEIIAPEDTPVTVPQTPAPTWALSNLLMALVGLVFLFLVMRRKDVIEEAAEEAKVKARRYALGVFLTAAANIVFFACTEPMLTYKMVVADSWTIWSAIILAATVILSLLTAKTVMNDRAKEHDEDYEIA
jgi:hypothetical protein